MGWKSSAHALQGVACVDCHNPHPSTELPRFANIQHAGMVRQKRLPMAVNDPDSCYPCHQNIATQFSLPSHHPLQQGKMKCASCHDTHGGATGNLNAPTVNLVCYKCHADKQGPFVYQHPPVEENCDICHNPHGTVANNLLRQPTTFLCLRCHSGHRGNSHSNIDQFQKGVAGGNLRPAFYTNCTQCHSQVHGSDVPSATRRGSRLQR
jgi:DmsE family decaheme c-type cytochrome